jgi:serine protease Do
MEGVILTNIEKDSPAEKAGLTAGDIVILVNGEKVNDASQLISAISNVVPGEVANFVIIRNGTKKEVKVKVGKRDDMVNRMESGEYWLGMKFDELDKHREKLEIPDRLKKGVLLKDVDEKSQAAEVGLKPGDIIDLINNQPIANLKALDEFIKKNKDKSQYLLRVIRNARIYFIVLENK